LENPSALDVAQAPSEQEDATGTKDTKIEGKWHGVVGVKGAVKNEGMTSGRHPGQRSGHSGDPEAYSGKDYRFCLDE